MYLMETCPEQGFIKLASYENQLIPGSFGTAMQNFIPQDFKQTS
ncbi:17158_t:CDS:2 [Racocetra persica]|uniref:17158_t:CDS:1 n=1 Tax=Racocetra persica TaxID=160502 RepID=A0ACA9PTX5_9GLOM|nr:17158_t:CDS:2 [Racocetra persica]